MSLARVQERKPDAEITGPLTYEAQLAAIRALLHAHRQAGAGGSHLHAVNAAHHPVLRDAARSMAAVGVLAPFLESLFHQSFLAMGRRRGFAARLSTRASMTKKWDCHYLPRKRKPHLVLGICQLAGEVGLTPFLPPDLRQTITALFDVRNRIFHHGFEWPEEEREAFARRAAAFPKAWFACADRNDGAWMFYATDVFIEHCLSTAEQVIGGLKQFERQARS